MSGKHTLLEAAANAWIEMGCETELLATAKATLGMIREIAALETERDALRIMAKIVAVDEYGPQIEWTTHWVDLIGKTLYVKGGE